MQQHPFRFSTGVDMSGTVQDLFDSARKVEDLGFDAIGCGDHHSDWMSPRLAMLAAAGVTKKIRIENLFANDFHHPMIMAKEVATMDLLTGGRFDFFLGTGWYFKDYQFYGVPMDPPMTRIRRMEEAVRICKLYFAGAPFEFQGKFFHVKEENPLPKTIQKHIPLTIGGGGQRILSIAAREADVIDFDFLKTRDGWVDYSSISWEATRQKYEWVCQAAGDRLGEIRFSIHFHQTKIVDSRSEAEAIIAGYLSMYGDPADADRVSYFLDSPHSLVGSESYCLEKIYRLREMAGVSILGMDVDDGARLIPQLAGK